MARVSAESRQLTHERLLRTAADHFARQGFDRAKVDRISLDAGYAKGTLYNYFPNKAALFAAVIERAARHAAELYAEASPGSSTRERLLGLARADVQVLREQQAFTRVLVREAMGFSPETYPLILKHLEPYVGIVEAVLADGAARGEVREDLPASQLALQFTGLLCLHYVQHWGSGGAWPALEDVPELVVGAFLDGAAPRRRADAPGRPAPARGRPAGGRA